MEQNKVVVRFKDGKIMKGNTSDFFPNKTQFHLTALSGEMQNIDVEKLKAVFFVKTSEGDESRSDNYGDEIAGGGRKIQVEFSDAEVVIGYTLSYSPDRHGFFMTPGDLKGNNERIFVVKSATKNVTFL
ncbi:MAG: hypothetical protein GY797_25530 [Deltaproteobacteria bacterium]|nr:hypothetical protein [Deltaproteobacteria bacterium]